MFLIEIKIPSRWQYNMAKSVTRPIFGLHLIGQKFLLPPKLLFFGTKQKKFVFLILSLSMKSKGGQVAYSSAKKK